MPRSSYSPRRSRSPSYSDECANIFCGNMNPTSNKYDLEKLFAKYGKIVDIWVARKPPGFGFVYMDDPHDARDAVRGLNGVTLHGSRLRIEISETNKNKLGPRGGYKERKEISRSERRSPSYGRDRDRGRRDRDYSDDDYRSRSRSRSYGRDRDRRGRDRDRGRRKYSRSRSRSRSRGRGRDSFSDAGYSSMAMMRGGPDRYSQKKGPRRTDFRVNLSGLAEGTSWQDLKSLFRKYAEPGYVQIYTKGEGIVEFNSLDEMEHVIKKLHDTKFRGSMVQLTEDAKCKAKRDNDISSKDRKRDKDTSPQRSHSRSRSRSRRSYSGSPSPPRSGRKRRHSPSRSQSRSKGRSRSRSPPKRSRRRSRSYSKSRSRSRGRDKKRGSRKEKRERKSKRDHEEDDQGENNDDYDDQKREKKKEQNGAANGHGKRNDNGKGKDQEYVDGESDDGE